MSKRLNKRQQRLQQEEQELAKPAPVAAENEGDAEEEEEVADVPRTSRAAANIFAALNDGLPEDDEEDVESEPEEAQAAVATKKKSKKKKKKSKVSTAASTDPATPSHVTASSSTPAGKKKQPKTATKEDDGMDEFEKALAELKLKFPDEGKAGSQGARSGEDKPSGRLALGLRNLLAIDTRKLDPDAELRKFFGSKVIATAAPGSSKRSLIKTHLSKPRPNWPKPSLLGLGMRELTPEEVEEKRARDGKKSVEGAERFFTLVHGGEYREAQRQFLGAISSHDPNQLSALLQVYPYHTDTILQMSEVYRQQSDLGQASDFIDRALFAFERAFIPAFNVSLGTGRLDFGRVENRGFFLALTRDLQFLGRRGCWNTSFHFAKLLLSIDPYSDPQAALLHLDFLALKSGHSQWVLDLTSTFDDALAEMGSGGSRVGVLPGWKWARALAVRNLEGEGEESKAALRDAVLSAPWVVPWLVDRAGLSLPDDFRQHPLFEMKVGYEGPQSTLHLLSHIHVVRCLPLYKEVSVLSYLSKTIPTFLPLVNDPSPDRTAALAFFKNGTPENIVRHVMVSEDNSTLLGFLERKWGQLMGMSFDPLPPRNSISAYDNDYFMNVVRRRGRGDRSAGRQDDENEDAGMMQAIMDSLMSMAGAGGDDAGQGAGGGMMAGLAGRLRAMLGGGPNGEGEVDEDERQAMLAQLMELAEDTRANRAGGPLPGGFPEDDEVTDDDDLSD